MKPKVEAELFGVMAEFDSAQALTDATEAVYKAGYRKIDAHSPFPIEAVCEAMNLHRNEVPAIVFLAGLTGGLIGFGMQCYSTMIHYPLNIGARPHYSWPAFIPVTFELTVLFAAFCGGLGMLALNGLPRPNHPVFNVKRFERASRDKFFLCIEATDPKFDLNETRNFLKSLHATEVFDVEP